MDNLEHEQLRLENQRVTAELKADMFMIDMKLEKIEKITTETLEHAKKTNGRVTELEKQQNIIELAIDKLKDSVGKIPGIESTIEFFSYIKKRKWFLIIIVLAFMKVYETIKINELIKWITTLF